MYTSCLRSIITSHDDTNAITLSSECVYVYTSVCVSGCYGSVSVHMYTSCLRFIITSQNDTNAITLFSECVCMYISVCVSVSVKGA